MVRPIFALLCCGAALGCGDAGPAAGSLLAISTGAFHACAITAQHAAACWGRNIYGGLGDGTMQDRLSPVRVAGGLRFDSISAGYEYTCALTANGAAWCWGENFGGQLGDGSTTNRPRPVQVATQERFRSITAGEAHTCGITLAGATLCWGTALGPDAGGAIPPDQLVPAPQPGPAFSAISSGYEIACALAANGAAYCWGLLVPGVILPGGQLSTNSPTAVEANGLLFTQVGAGTKHACALTAAGAAWCWGQNGSGQLGDSSFTESLAARPVAGAHVFARLSAHSPAHACALTAEGAAWCWGAGGLGSLGDGAGTTRSVPVAVAGAHAFAALATGFAFSCGIDRGGAGWCWGAGGSGQLGTGGTGDALAPVPLVVP